MRRDETITRHDRTKSLKLPTTDCVQPFNWKLLSSCFTNSHGLEEMAEAQEDKPASTRADRSSDLKPMARHQEDYPTVDAYQTCCIISTEEEVALSNENVVTEAAPRLSPDNSSGAAPRARLTSSIEIVPGLLHGTLDQKTRTRQDKN